MWKVKYQAVIVSYQAEQREGQKASDDNKNR